jgi:hypothetical protein
VSGSDESPEIRPRSFKEQVLKISARFWYLVCNVNPAEEPERKPAAIFYASRKPYHELKRERPVHIAAAHLAAAGASNARIARMLGKSEVWAANLTRQPFFQERVEWILKERNLPELEATFKMQRFSNPVALVELRPDGPVDTRTVRAKDILDRAFRKKEVASADHPVANVETLSLPVARRTTPAAMADKDGCEGSPQAG